METDAANTEAEVKRFRIIGRYSPITCMLIQRLENSQPDDAILDEELNRIAGKDVSPKGNHNSYLQSAIRYCEQMGICWQRVRGEGYIKRSSPGDIIVGSEQAVKSTHRKMKRSVARLGSITNKMDELEPGEKKRALTAQAQVGTLCAFSNFTIQRKLSARNIEKPIDVVKLLEHSKDATLDMFSS